MKKHLLYSFMTVVSINCYSQVTINGSDINPQVGDVQVSNNIDYVSPGASGANQTWDFSALTSTGTATFSIISSTTNGANQAYSYSGAVVHYNNTSSAQEMKTIEASGTVITYTDGEKILQFPLSFNANYSDTFYATFITNGYPAVRSGDNTLTVDGYGSLILPGQTITDVLRVKLEQDYSDNIDIGAPYIIDYETEIYIWYKIGVREPLMSLSSLTSSTGGLTEYGYYTNITNVGTEEIRGIDEVVVLGNPFQNILNFAITASESKSIQYQIIDVTGANVLLSSENMVSIGTNNFAINTDDLPAGIYGLRILDENNSITKLVIKQ